MTVTDTTPPLALEWTVSISPNPKDLTVTSKVFFRNAAEKRLYVKMEATHCLKEFQDYASVMSKVERTKKYEALCGKRVAFARKMGYAPKKSNNRVWEKGTHVPGPTPTNYA